MVEIAKFDYQNKSEDRGKYYFSNSPSDEESILGNSFLRLVLECIIVWGSWFLNSEFAEELHELILLGVNFPSEFNYFQEEN